MNSIKQELINKLNKQDASRPRSKQISVGPSEIGGCQRRMWYRINGIEPTNLNTLRLAANMGTAIHSLIEDAFAGDKRYLLEESFEVGDLKGHVDLIDLETKTIWDWKTTTKTSLSYFPSMAQREQVQLYGYLANKQGLTIEQVGLVAIARDGNEDDIVEYCEPYDEAIALNALARYHAVKEQFEPPRPEKDADFCAKYCPFFGECTGIVNQSSEELIANPELIGLIEDYREVQETIKKANSQLDFIKSMLDGTTGTTPSGITVKWSQVSGRQTTDEAKVQELLGFVPKKQGNGYARLTVK